jgi:hypothetical protein
MSISFSMSEGRSTLEEMREARLRAGGDAKRATSAARVAANRRNAQRSTGPRSVEGKRRSARNALKHGLCRTLVCLPSECEATFMTFVGELEQELRPATPLQRLTFNQIASLTWRLERLPEAQARIVEQELGKVEPDDRDERASDGTVQLKPSDVLARRFSDEPAANGFALLENGARTRSAGSALANPPTRSGTSCRRTSARRASRMSLRRRRGKKRGSRNETKESHRKN